MPKKENEWSAAELREIIDSEAADWFQSYFLDNYDQELRSLTVDPPTVFDCFRAGWRARENFDKVPE